MDGFLDGKRFADDQERERGSEALAGEEDEAAGPDALGAQGVRGRSEAAERGREEAGEGADEGQDDGEEDQGGGRRGPRYPGRRS